MAENLTGFIPEQWADRTLEALRDGLKLANIVNQNYNSEVMEQGDTVNIPKPIIPSVSFKQKGTDYTDSDAESETVSVQLSRQPYWTHVFEDADRATSKYNLVEQFMVPAGHALGKAIEEDIATLFASFSTVVSDYTTDITEAIIAKANAKLTLNKAPEDDGQRFLVLHPDVMGVAQTLWNLTRADASGDGGAAVRNGVVGYRFGVNFLSSNFVNKPAATQTDNVLMHRNAIGLIMRPLPDVNDPGAAASVLNVDGYSLRVVTGYDHRAGGLRVTISTLYGVKVFYDDLGILLKAKGVA